MSSRLDKEKQRLRQYLNKTIKGPNTDAVLEALSTGSCHLIENIEAINDMLYITSAEGSYLDSRMADRDLSRPENVGLSDQTFREIGIEVVNRKQVRDLIHSILESMYGAEFTNAFTIASEVEPYQLEDGDELLLQFDGQDPVKVTFKAEQFQNINTATSQEVSDAIVRGLRSNGHTGSAYAKSNETDTFVTIISNTKGPSSTVSVLGGKAQNAFKFPQIKPTTAEVTTQWTLEVQPSGLMRMTWTGGPNPSIGKVAKNDYVNIYGSAFSSDNQGTYTIVNVKGGLVNESYVEFDNINGINQVTLQGDLEGILFYSPKKSRVSDNRLFALSYQTESRLLEVFIPATTKIIRREREGSAHIQDNLPSVDEQYGPYIYDTTKKYVISDKSCLSTQKVDRSTERTIDVDDASQIPDSEGFLVFGFGTDKEEGPVPYTSRPSSGTILINPAYQFENDHEIGTDITFISQNFPIELDSDGSDFGTYITDVVSGRIYAQDLIKLVKATGIVLNLVVLYPNDVGLGKWGDYQNSERYYVWGEDPEDKLFDEDEINERI